MSKFRMRPFSPRSPLSSEPKLASAASPAAPSVKAARKYPGEEGEEAKMPGRGTAVALPQAALPGRDTAAVPLPQAALPDTATTRGEGEGQQEGEAFPVEVERKEEAVDAEAADEFVPESAKMAPGAFSDDLDVYDSPPVMDPMDEKAFDMETSDGIEEGEFAAAIENTDFAFVAEAILPAKGRLTSPLTTRRKTHVVEKPMYNPGHASERIRKIVCKRFGSKSASRKVLVDELFLLTELDRSKLVQTYNHLFPKQPLESVIRKQCGGALRELLLALTLPLDEWNAKWLQAAVSKKDTTLLSTLMCTMEMEQLRAAQAIFDKKHRKSLLKQISSMTSSLFRKRNIHHFYKSLLVGGRCEEPEDDSAIDSSLVKRDALAIWTSVEVGDTAADTSHVFLDMFATRSFSHLAQVSVEFSHISSGSDVIQVLRRLFKSSSETGHACVVAMYYASRRHEYLADLMIRATRTRNFDILSRVVVMRAEIDIGNIWDICGMSVESWLEDTMKKEQECLYKDLLLSYCTPL